MFINLETKKTKKDTDNNAATNEQETDNVLKTLEEECFSALKTIIGKNFPDLKSVYLALPIECYREIADKLPQTREELLEIDQMTHFRFDRFGKYLLEVCKDFNGKRMAYLEDKQLAELLAKEEEAQVFNAPISNNPIYQNDSQRRTDWISKTGSRGRGTFNKKGGSYSRGNFRGRGRGKKRSYSPSPSTSGSSSFSTAKKAANAQAKLGLMSLSKAGKSGLKKL